ncbi:MAG: hypothetical protein DRJ65_00395 [Acidobacteria bacterium]|nr:MAG: hypothetical protein DRJ65_00395 [Acidobacteriota bacterium]
MRRLLLVFMTLVAFSAGAETSWIPVAAHLTGFGGSVWRSDVAIHNGCGQSAEIEITLHHSGGTSSQSLTVAAGASVLLEDVVADLVSGNISGSLEIVSDQVLTIRSRTFNQADTGTFGQSLDAVVEDDGIDFARSAIVGQLLENQTFRSNIGVINMGGIDAEVEIELFDRFGASVGTFELDVPAGRVIQDGRPFSARFGRNDIEGGFARVMVLRGTDVFAYGSVVDNDTGDPTTVVMDKGTVQPLSEVSRRAAEIALAARTTAEGSALWVLEDLEVGSTIRENAYADRAQKIEIPNSGGPWHLVVVDPEPNQRYGHPMQWMLIDGSSEQVHGTVTVGYPPLVEPASRPTGSFFTEVARGTVEDHPVRTLIGDGGPADADHSHKQPFKSRPINMKSAAPLRSPISIGMVMDGGGDGDEAMAENDADPIGKWLEGEDFEVERYSQYKGNRHKYFETPTKVRNAIKATGTRLSNLGPPSGGECDNYFLYIGGHGTTTKGVPNDGVDIYSVDAPGFEFTLDYDYLLESFSSFPSHVKVTIFVDACYSGQLIGKTQKIKRLCSKLCALTLITAADATSTTAASNSLIDSSTEDFLEGAKKDHDGDGNVGDIKDRYEEMSNQKVVGITMSYHCPECKTWCTLDGDEETESACAGSSDEYIAVVTDIIDLGGHDPFDGDPLDSPIGFNFECPEMTAEGSGDFVDVAGSTTLMGESECAFSAVGRGTVAGFPNIAVLMEGVVDSNTDTMTGQYSFGVEGGLPGGHAITYVFEAATAR